MADPDPITLAAFNLVKALIEADASAYRSEVGPVHDGEGREFGSYLVTVEKREK